LKKASTSRDPYASRESAKYENPIPSREFILDLLRESVGPLTHQELCEALSLTGDDDREALRRRLAAMERDGQLISNRRGGYGTLDKMNLTKGRVQGHPEGFGFVVTGGDQDIYLSSRQMRRVFDGDEVLVRVSGWDRRGRPEGSIVEVLEQRTEKLVGRYFVESGMHFVRPDNPRINQDIILPPGDTGGAVSGQVVLVAITSQPSRQRPPAGRIIQVLGDHQAPGLEIQVAIHNYGIPHEWREGIDGALAAIPDQVQEQDKLHRVDLRNLDLVTIDGEDARDFDDAVYCEPVNKGGWRLIVAIADVSHYVWPDSLLDREAFKRGTSVYFPGQVVPMLPEKLSNGLCSLNPEADRLCMVCDMRIDTEGHVSRFQFCEGIMHSRARLTYTQVAAMIADRDDPQSAVRKQFRGVVGRIDHLHDLYRVLKQARELRGAIDFETGETRILFDEHRKIQQIIPVMRTDAHRLIEECMLSANVCAAQLLEKSKLPALYRVHEPPGLEKLSDLREFLAELGLGLRGGDDPSPLDYQAVLDQVRDRPDAQVIQTVMLRSMKRAHYTDENAGHFGLNYEAYTHFTSPIRRYPDLLVHRAIRALIRSKRRVPHLKRLPGATTLDLATSYPYSQAWVAEAGEQSSFAERRADDATRDVETWLKCEYLVDRVGDEFTGVVTSVTGFGLFVALDDLFVEGLIHITGLPKDYYNHEPAHHRLVGERTRRVFRLGDPVRVRVARVDLEERKIDFELIETPGQQRRSGRKEREKQDLGSPPVPSVKTAKARSPSKRIATAGSKDAAKSGQGDDRGKTRSRPRKTGPRGRRQR